MRIAVCDDDPQILLEVLSRLASYQVQRQTELFCQSFGNAIDLLMSMDRENFDLLFLDVLMPSLSGIQAAREIRQKNENIKIVFLTSSPEYAVESYSVQATNYLLKPATEERLFPILDQIADLLRKPEEALVIRTQGSVLRLPYKKIEYIEVMSKILYFHLTDGSAKKVRGSLSEYEPALLPCFFCLVQRPKRIRTRQCRTAAPNHSISDQAAGSFDFPSLAAGRSHIFKQKLRISGPNLLVDGTGNGNLAAGRGQQFFLAYLGHPSQIDQVRAVNFAKARAGAGQPDHHPVKKILFTVWRSSVFVLWIRLCLHHLHRLAV
jgi:DNA-binding LytR/AlgR family response regulator